MDEMTTTEQTTAQPNACGCATDGLKRPPAWQGLTLASVLPEATPADAAPEPDAPQGEYDPRTIEAPLSVPLIAGESPKHEVELLAPAGGLDAGYAAFHYGADAIYLGLKKFSARAEAENFTLDDLDAITSFAHALERKRRVFVTVNTVILQNELRELVEVLGAMSEIGVDALIIQDMGVYNIVRRHFPELELHASTQLAVHNRAGAEALKAMGFTRVVLARELTIEEVADITATSGIETEVFIHGALCYSYSGLCLFSSQTNGRSGNRGKCAYSCRDEFQISGAPETLRDGTATKRSAEHGFAFSMKDLALPDHLPAIRAAGVSCVKIEGRKKSPLYVATTTDYYRRLLDGSLPKEDRAQHEADMQTVFSRPWTRLFTLSHKYKEVADRDTVGHRGTRIGVVEKVLDANSAQPFVRFKTSRPLERHDGLQIDVPQLGKPFGFAVETLHLIHPDSRRKATLPLHVTPHRIREPYEEVFEAPADAIVEVAMPEEHPFIPDGAPIYCSSSQDVKRRYRHAHPKPGLYRTRRVVDVEIKLGRDELAVYARVSPRDPSPLTPLPQGERGTAPIEIRRLVRGPFSKVKDAAKMSVAARGAFEKLGETRLALGEFAFENPDGCFVPVSQLNALRRDVADELERALDAQLQKRLNAVCDDVLPRSGGAPAAERNSSIPNGGKSAAAPIWSIKVDRIAFLDEFDDREFEHVDEIVIDIARDHATVLAEKLERLAARIGLEHIRLALPPVTRKWEEHGIELKLARLREMGFSKWEAGNVSAWSYLNARELLMETGRRDAGGTGAARAGGTDLATDWSVYVVNRMAARQVIAMGARRFALSPEDGLENMRSLLAEFGAKAVVIVHQDTPMFMAESCAYANLIGGCPGKANCRFESMDMVSSYGEKVQAIDYHCRTIVLNKGAFCIAPRSAELCAAGAVSLRADFIYRNYAADDVVKIWRLVRAGKNVPHGHAANFDRGML